MSENRLREETRMSAEVEVKGSNAHGAARTSRVLVVYYTRTGQTKGVAEDIAKRLGCDIEEIFDTKKRGGPLGFLSAGKDAGDESLTKIKEPKCDPSAYDLVIIGTPVWNNTISTPIRTYISMKKDKIANAAFFITQGRKESDALDVMRQVLAKEPKAPGTDTQTTAVPEVDYLRKAGGQMYSEGESERADDFKSPARLRLLETATGLCLTSLGGDHSLAGPSRV
jgi:flavodoxin